MESNLRLTSHSKFVQQFCYYEGLRASTCHWRRSYRRHHCRRQCDGSTKLRNSSQNCSVGHYTVVSLIGAAERLSVSSECIHTAPSSSVSYSQPQRHCGHCVLPSDGDRNSFLSASTADMPYVFASRSAMRSRPIDSLRLSRTVLRTVRQTGSANLSSTSSNGANRHLPSASLDSRVMERAKATSIDFSIGKSISNAPAGYRYPHHAASARYGVRRFDAPVGSPLGMRPVQHSSPGLHSDYSRDGRR